MTRFLQPGENAAILNRVTGPDASGIYGRLEGNGKIYLVNPHGVVVGPEGVVETASFLGTQNEIDFEEFMEGEAPEILLGSGIPRLFIRPEGMAAKNVYEMAVNREGNEEAGRVYRTAERVFLVDSSALLSLLDDSDESGTKDFIESDLEALQQIRTLIPERLWVQEFAILVKPNAFEEPMQAMMKHSSMGDSRFYLGDSHYYYLKSTMSGEWIRIRDYFQEFEQGPFWRNPPMLENLRAWEREEME